MFQVFYLSIATGSQTRVAQHVKYPYILVNFMTKNAYYCAKTTRRYAKTLLIDSGGAPESIIKNNGYNRSDIEYLHFVRVVKADYFVLRDYPCEPQVLRKFNVTVKDQIHRTLDHHLKLIELYERSEVKATPIPVIQGWEVEDFLYCVDMFKEHGLLNFDYIAIGSTCRRHQVKQTQKIILAVREAVPRKIKLHAFGVKLSVLDHKAVWDALYSADSSAWDFLSRWKDWRNSNGDNIFDQSLKMLNSYLNRLNELRKKYSSQMTLLREFFSSTNPVKRVDARCVEKRRFTENSVKSS